MLVFILECWLEQLWVKLTRCVTREEAAGVVFPTKEINPGSDKIREVALFIRNQLKVDTLGRKLLFGLYIGSDKTAIKAKAEELVDWLKMPVTIEVVDELVSLETCFAGIRVAFVLFGAAAFVGLGYYAEVSQWYWVVLFSFTAFLTLGTTVWLCSLTRKSKHLDWLVWLSALNLIFFIAATAVTQIHHRMEPSVPLPPANATTASVTPTEITSIGSIGTFYNLPNVIALSTNVLVPSGASTLFPARPIPGIETFTSTVTETTTVTATSILTVASTVSLTPNATGINSPIGEPSRPTEIGSLSKVGAATATGTTKSEGFHRLHNKRILCALGCDVWTANWKLMQYSSLERSSACSTLAKPKRLITREVPQEHSHKQFLNTVKTSLLLHNPLNIIDPGFGLLGNAAAAGGSNQVDPTCMQQATADQAFTNAKQARDVIGMTAALVYRALERNTGSVGAASVPCVKIKAVNPQIAAISQLQDPASPNAAAINKAIILELAKQIASIGGDPQTALKSGTFSPGTMGGTTDGTKIHSEDHDFVGSIIHEILCGYVEGMALAIASSSDLERLCSC